MIGYAASGMVGSLIAAAYWLAMGYHDSDNVKTSIGIGCLLAWAIFTTLFAASWVVQYG
jgi:hypothetical protein